MKLDLVRFIDAPFGTYGELYLPEFSCLTCERPWLANVPKVSCIPPGVYKLKPTLFRGELETLEIADVPGRSLIKIHKGNVPADVLGCIVLGNSWGWIRDTLAVLNSASTFERWWAVAQRVKPELIEIRYKEAPQSIHEAPKT